MGCVSVYKSASLFFVEMMRVEMSADVRQRHRPGSGLVALHSGLSAFLARAMITREDPHYCHELPNTIQKHRQQQCKTWFVVCSHSEFVVHSLIIVSASQNPPCDLPFSFSESILPWLS